MGPTVHMCMSLDAEVFGREDMSEIQWKGCDSPGFWFVYWGEYVHVVLKTPVVGLFYLCGTRIVEQYSSCVFLTAVAVAFLSSVLNVFFFLPCN